MINYPPIDELAQKTGSKYALCVIASKRARQLIAGAPAYIKDTKGKKPLSIAVEELYEGKIRITGDGGDDPEDNA